MHKKRILTSAPALAIAALAFIAAAWGIEHQMRANNESLLAFALSSDDGQEFDARITTALPEAVTEALTGQVIATAAGSFQLDTLSELELFELATPEARLAMTAFTGRLLSSRNRFAEALVVLRSLSPDERDGLEASFAYAEALKGSGEIDAALIAYQRHIANNPNHQAGHINLAILLMRLDQHGAARPVLERAVEITSGRRKGKSFALLGILHMELAEFDQAERAFQQSIEFRPSHAPTWRRLAQAQARSGAIAQDEVIATFQRAAALSPGNGLIEIGLAEFFFSTGRFDDALAPFRSASRMMPQDGEVLLSRALNLLVSERPSAARNVLRTLRSMELDGAQEGQAELLEEILNGSNASVLRHLRAHEAGHGLAERDVFLQILGHLDVGDYDNARRFADDLASASIFFQPTRFQIARQLYRDGRTEEARAELQALVANNDQSPIFWLYLARAQTDPQAALSAHRRAHQLLPRSGRMTIEFAQALNSVGQSEPAITTLFAYLDDHPNETRALRALAGIFDANQQLGRAEQIYRVIYDLNTDDMSVGTALADIQYRAGRFDAALETLDSLVELQPALISIRQSRAETLMRLSREVDARMELERILRLDPGNETATTMLANYAG
ncbi:tetratricopeptide repeat protein [Maricaulis sp.]|uniref:tetratricopeptide repeat protein n=1 Tax=Maricaulis sp. TaxID=1486257 RepID=UPI00262105E5|nr:tetratricopeptide repeat protein [Maricaulis sp.]